jgi:hypothetical protein
LTEAKPAVKAYDENIWSRLADARIGPIEPSLALLDGLHARIGQLLKALSAEDWKKEFIHSERGLVSLDANVPMYAWHGRHHTAHITATRKRMGW